MQGTHNTHLEVLLEHRQFKLLGALRIIGIQHDPLAHHVPGKDAHTVLALGAHRLPILEEFLSQLVHLKESKRVEGRGRSGNQEGECNVYGAEEGVKSNSNTFAHFNSSQFRSV